MNVKYVIHHLLTLRDAEDRGFGIEATLRQAVNRKKLQAIKKGKLWITCECYLVKAGYKNNLIKDNE